MWFLELINGFVIGYPIFVSIIWIIGCLFEIKQHRYERTKFKLQATPLASILVPAHNEHDTLENAVQSIAHLDYPNFEVILVDDKSSDDTLDIMYHLQKKYQNKMKIKIVPIPVNKGKANAMNMGLKNSSGDYIMGIDADSLLDPQSLSRIIATLQANPNAGAVAGKPVVRNRTTILGRLQLLEYIGVIDIIKRAQAFLAGRVTTVSGVIVGFRKKALENVHGWNPKVITEDIDITWRMYRHDWQVIYNPDIICWILVPESVKSLIIQRRRWARGGLEVLSGNWDVLLHGKLSKRFLLAETITSNLWAILTSLSIISYFFSFILIHNLQLDGNVLLILLIISGLQFVIGFYSSKKQALINFTDLLLVPAYVVYYWIINLISCISAMISFFLDPEQIGTWRSPDRGRH